MLLSPGTGSIAAPDDTPMLEQSALPSDPKQRVLRRFGPWDCDRGGELAAALEPELPRVPADLAARPDGTGTRARAAAGNCSGVPLL